MSFCLKEALDKTTASFPPKRGIYLVAISIISECAKGGESSKGKASKCCISYPACWRVHGIFFEDWLDMEVLELHAWPNTCNK